jgi:putative copper resistance protein D
MPPWLKNESAGIAAPAHLPTRFRRILWIEGVVLLAAVMLAAILASTSPPGEQM